MSEQNYDTYGHWNSSPQHQPYEHHHQHFQNTAQHFHGHHSGQMIMSNGQPGHNIVMYHQAGHVQSQPATLISMSPTPMMPAPPATPPVMDHHRPELEHGNIWKFVPESHIVNRPAQSQTQENIIRLQQHQYQQQQQHHQQMQSQHQLQQQQQLLHQQKLEHEQHQRNILHIKQQQQQKEQQLKKQQELQQLHDQQKQREKQRQQQLQEQQRQEQFHKTQQHMQRNPQTHQHQQQYQLQQKHIYPPPHMRNNQQQQQEMHEHHQHEHVKMDDVVQRHISITQTHKMTPDQTTIHSSLRNVKRPPGPRPRPVGRDSSDHRTDAVAAQMDDLKIGSWNDEWEKEEAQKQKTKLCSSTGQASKNFDEKEFRIENSQNITILKRPEPAEGQADKDTNKSNLTLLIEKAEERKEAKIKKSKNKKKSKSKQNKNVEEMKITTDNKEIAEDEKLTERHQTTKINDVDDMEKVEDVTEVKAPGAYKPRAKKKDVESVHTEPGNHGRNRNAGILPIARLSDIRALSMFGANEYMVPPSHNYYTGFYPGMDPYNPYSGGFHPSNRRMSRGRGQGGKGRGAKKTPATKSSSVNHPSEDIPKFVIGLTKSQASEYISTELSQKQIKENDGQKEEIKSEE